MQTKKEGDAVQATYYRQGQPHTVTVTLAAHQSESEGHESMWLDDGRGGNIFGRNSEDFQERSASCATERCPRR